MSVVDRLLAMLPPRLTPRLHRTGRKRRGAAARAAFEAALARLGPDDVCVDCGANVGAIAARLAATGATVHAFEPDPEAFAALSARLGGAANVVLHQAAVGPRAGEATLHFSRRRGEDPVGRSVTSSLLTESYRVDPEAGVRVRVIDFPAFLAGLPRPPALVKIDIEGAEVALLEALRDSGALARLGAVFVETHEKQLPSLRRRTFALIAGGREYPNVNFDWW